MIVDWVAVIGVSSVPIAMFGIAVAPSKGWRFAFGCGAWGAVLFLFFLIPEVAAMDITPKIAVAIGASLLAFGIAWTPVKKFFAVDPAPVPTNSAQAASSSQLSDRPLLSASFTEMVQLFKLDSNDTFHGMLESRPYPTTMVFVQVVVKNDGAPSTANDWSLWITVNGNDEKAEGFPAPDFTFRVNPSAPAISYAQSEAIYNISVRRPITRELPARGFFIGRFNLSDKIVAGNLGTLRLRFSDALGNVYESVKKSVGIQRPDAEFVPGIGTIER